MCKTKTLFVLLLALRCVVSKTRVGIIGLPNVGKSTLFNALARKSLAQAANFPFCTIEPNIAPIAVPDAHLVRLAALANSRRAVPATIDWVDVAGLVRGASRGEGLGNQFLATARECNALCHVVRTFEDVDTIHVEGRVDPVADAEVINVELILADLAHAARRLEKTTCQGEERDALEAVVAVMEKGMPARSAGLSAAAAFTVKSLGLLTLKPVLYAFNVDECDFALDTDKARKHAEAIFDSIQHSDPSTDAWAVVSAKLEAEVSQLSEDAQLAYLETCGMESDGKPLDEALSYNVLPTAVRSLLNLGLVFTGPGVPPERSCTTRAHLHKRGRLTAEALAGRIHGTIEKGFITAEVAPAADLLQHASFGAAREAGCVRTEGRTGALCDGDVVHVRWK